MNPQPHSILHFLSKGNRLDVRVCHSSGRQKIVEVTREKIYPSPDWQYGALSCKTMIPSNSTPGRFDFMTRRSTLSHQETNHTSLLFFVCLHFQCWTNALYTTLTSKAIKKHLCESVRFHYTCLLPYIWQYRYVATVFPAFARNVFYGGCSVFIRLPFVLKITVFLTAVALLGKKY